MPEYRFYVVAQNGHIYQPPLTVEAANDAAALTLARGRLQAGDIEVWQGPRLVAYLAAEQPAATSGPRSEPDQSTQA